MKIAMIHTFNTAVGQYRQWTPAKYLAREAGWQVKEFPHWLTYQRLIMAAPGRLHAALADSDLAVYGWFASPSELLAFGQLRERTAAPSIIDLDDDLFDVPEGHLARPAFVRKEAKDCFEEVTIPAEASLLYLQRGWQVGRDTTGTTIAVRQTHMNIHDIFPPVLQACNGLTVSTPYLADRYREHVPAQWPVWTLPNCFDPDAWITTHVDERDYPTLVWAGSLAHEGNLRLILPALRAVLKKLPNAKLVVFGADLPTFRELPQNQIERVGWAHPENYPQVLSSLGGWVGIAPAADNSFNRAKSHIRWLEYSLAGLPSICSPRDEYRAWSGDDGALMAETPAEWEAYLLMLLGDATLRKKLRASAWERAQECNILKHLDKWTTAYTEAVHKGVTMFRGQGVDADGT